MPRRSRSLPATLSILRATRRSIPSRMPSSWERWHARGRRVPIFPVAPRMRTAPTRMPLGICRPMSTSRRRKTSRLSRGRARRCSATRPISASRLLRARISPVREAISSRPRLSPCRLPRPRLRLIPPLRPSTLPLRIAQATLTRPMRTTTAPSSWEGRSLARERTTTRPGLDARLRPTTATSAAPRCSAISAITFRSCSKARLIPVKMANPSRRKRLPSLKSPLCPKNLQRKKSSQRTKSLPRTTNPPRTTSGPPTIPTPPCSAPANSVTPTTPIRPF